MPVAMIVLAAGAAMLMTELFAPGRPWPAVRGWWTRAILLNAVQAGSVYLAGVTWDHWFRGAALWHAEPLVGTTGGALLGYLVITFIYYWWHRARHEVQFFWNTLHQIHHSPTRLEVLTTFYKHPAEILINSALSSAILYGLCGLSPEAGAQAVLLTGLAELFYHWNVRTPRWIGYFVQRPESHCIHHKLGWHTQNYSDLPLWDMLFGTFHNPRSFDGRCGFKGDREQELGRMLLGEDLNRKPVKTGAD